jgi:hypothetical protein
MSPFHRKMNVSAARAQPNLTDWFVEVFQGRSPEDISIRNAGCKKFIYKM